jgi:hypothetical protein
MPLCLAFEDNRPPVLGPYRRPPEQKNATDNVSVGVATRGVTSLVAIPFALAEVRHEFAETQRCQTSECKHLVAKHNRAVSHPGGHETTTNIAAQLPYATPILPGSNGDCRRPYDELTTPMSPPTQRRTTGV